MGSPHIALRRIHSTLTAKGHQGLKTTTMANAVVIALGAISMIACAQGQGFGFPGMGGPPMMGGFPGMGGMMGGRNPFMGMGGGMGGGMQQGPSRPEFLTCIAKDQQDPSSQVRLTLTRSLRGNSMGGRRMGGGPMMGGPMMGGMMDDGFDDMDMDDMDDDMSEFRVDGTFVPGMSANKAGTYRVVITAFGRIADGCSAQSLGPVLSAARLRRRAGPGGMPGMPGMMGGMPGMGAGFGMPGMGMGGGMMGPYSRFGRNFWQGGSSNRGPVGQLQNPAIVGTSATVYSDHIEGVATNDLLGRGIALCRGIQNGQCVGHIPYCCTVQRDSLPAMEMSVNRMGGMDDDDGFGMRGNPMMAGGMGQGGMGGGMGGAMGGGMGGGMDMDNGPSNGGLF